MASVQNSRGKKYARLLLLEDEPKEHLESEGEKLIKELVQQQTNTKITFEEVFSNKKEFQKGTGFIPLSALEGGTSTLTEFEEKRDCAERIQELTSRGLTYEESDRIIRGEDPVKRTNKVEVSALENRRREIDRLLQTRDKDGVVRKASVSRQDKELILATKPGSLHTRLLEFALSCKTNSKEDSYPPDHPINHLDELEKQLFSDKQKHVFLESTVRRKRRQLLEAQNPPQGPSSYPDLIKNKSSSLWDVLDKPQRVTIKNQTAVPTKVYSCKEKSLYTVHDGKIVQLDKKDLNQLDKCEDKKRQQKSGYGKAFVAVNVGGEESVNILESDQQLTLEEIKQIPRFKDYQTGEPSQILYIKNLPNSMKEEDLVSVFAKYEDPTKQKLIYRVMAGRMRGQAFVTFPNIEMATVALNGTNGIVVKGKPLIVQFGKNKTT